MFGYSIKHNVKLVKDTKKTTLQVDQTDTQFERVATIVVDAFDKGLTKIGGAVVTYVILDTARKVLIAKASQHH